MPLIPCPECNREISTEAEACPQCGYPVSVAPTTKPGPQCYARKCDSPATTRCHECGVFSCPTHVQARFVPHDRGGANELLCASCIEVVNERKRVGRRNMKILLGGLGVYFIFILIIVVMSKIEQRKQAEAMRNWEPPKVIKDMQDRQNQKRRGI